MPKVYNTTRGPVSFVTASGQVASVAPKTWCDITDEEAGSPSLIQHMARGSIVLKEDEVPAPPAPVEPPVEVVVAPVVEAPAPSALEVKEEPAAAAPEIAKVEETAKVEEPSKPVEEAPVEQPKAEAPKAEQKSGKGGAVWKRPSSVKK